MIARKAIEHIDQHIEGLLGGVEPVHDDFNRVFFEELNAAEHIGGNLRITVYANYGGLAFEEEGERCSQLLTGPKVKVMVMGNHGVMVIGDTVADAF
ncbi:class II aldolase/adducin family protein, partial [Mesorhizobium sp. M8A.F.Ca.ET.165.01.1.1]|uniref:class II aldolase/adducin family protein n=1 Tax=Mesorhizobium sp. M8A.F.Ca.ET.165.01.1.1 TaxID=2563960 RepID=UPI001FE1CB91